MKHYFIHLSNQKAVADDALYFKEFYDMKFILIKPYHKGGYLIECSQLPQEGFVEIPQSKKKIYELCRISKQI